MKKNILNLLAVFGLSSLSFGQAVLEHTYNSDFNHNETNAFLTEEGLHFWTWEDYSNIVNVYNDSHNLVKTINIPSQLNVWGISLISDKLFNNDELLEFIVVTSTDNYTLVNENGIILQDLGIGYGTDGIKLLKVGEQYKLITYHYNPAVYSVYSLPGTYLDIIESPSIQNKLIGYPNPTTNKLYISNVLENGESAVIEIFDTNGKKVMEEQVSRNNSEISIDVSDLSNGVYIYKINDKTSKFIKK